MVVQGNGAGMGDPCLGMQNGGDMGGEGEKAPMP